jgi:hypothetical protein
MVPQVQVLNYAATPLGNTLAELVAVLNLYYQDYVTPEWGCALSFVAMDPPPPAAQMEAALVGKWALIILDDATVAGAEGFHEESPEGLPRGYAFAKTTIDAGDSFSVTLTHEAAEMGADSLTNQTVMGPLVAGKQSFWIQEIADPVEMSDFTIDGIRVSNFVTRNYYNQTPPAAKFDQLGHLAAPFSLESGGYVSIWTAKLGWSQSFGSKKAEDHFRANKLHKYSRHSKRMAKTPLGSHG